VVAQDPGFTDGTLVHETTHLLHNRMGHGSLGHYLEEGTAQDLQRLHDAAHAQRGHATSGACGARPRTWRT
jgi:hypothetical protein